MKPGGLPYLLAAITIVLGGVLGSIVDRSELRRRSERQRAAARDGDVVIIATTTLRHRTRSARARHWRQIARTVSVGWKSTSITPR